MRLLVIALLAGLALSSCGPVAQFEALDECLKRLAVVFPEAKGLSDQDISDDITGFLEDRPDGGFNFANPAADGSPLWSCKGNSKSRRIAEVSFKGVVKSPAIAEVWSY